MNQLAVIVFFSLSFHLAGAQNAFHEKVLQVGGTIGVPVYADFEIPNIENRETVFTIGFFASADFAIFKRLSFGGAIGVHRFNYTVDDYTYEINGVINTSDAELKVSSFAAYGRGLWHFYDIYEKTDQKLDLYAGIGTGFFDYKYQIETSDFQDDSYTQKGLVRPYGLVGVRYYPTTNLGIHLEAAFPADYLMVFGIAYRFEWQAINF